MRLRSLWLILLIGWRAGLAATPDNEQVINAFMQLLIGNEAYTEQAFATLEREWDPGFVAMSLDVVATGRSSERTARLITLLEAETGQAFGYDMAKWYEWLWNRPEQKHPAC